MLTRKDGSPAADAIVSIAQAPLPMPEIAMVADAAGRVTIDSPVAGRFVLSVWVEGRAYRLSCDLTLQGGTAVLRLPT